MTPEKQHDAISEACIKIMHCARCDAKATLFRYGAAFCGEDCAERASDFAIEASQMSIPNWLNDLNAMHEAEKVLRNQFTTQERHYWNLLQYVKPHPIYATAAQRAEAFLRAIDKWEE